METTIDLDTVYTASEDIVTREIEEELIIVPLVSGIGDEDDLFTLNETGRAIWDKLDGQKDLKSVIEELSAEFGAADGEIAEDVTGFVEELLKRKLLIEISGG